MQIKKQQTKSKKKNRNKGSRNPRWRNTIGDMYDLKKMCEEKGFKLLGSEQKDS